MHKLIQLEMYIKPYSANAMYRCYLGRIILSKTARLYRKELKKLIELCMIGQSKIEGGHKMIVDITIYSPNILKFDLDNTVKILLDTMQGIVFDNDRYIDEMHTRKVNCNKDKIVILVKDTVVVTDSKP